MGVLSVCMSVYQIYVMNAQGGQKRVLDHLGLELNRYKPLCGTGN